MTKINNAAPAPVGLTTSDHMRAAIDERWPTAPAPVETGWIETRLAALSRYCRDLDSESGDADLYDEAIAALTRLREENAAKDAEIERLTSDLKEANENVVTFFNSITSLVVECQRQRAENKLKDTALQTAETMLSEMHLSPDEKCQMIYDFLHEARAALPTSPEPAKEPRNG